jgi:hypothetical protein
MAEYQPASEPTRPAPKHISIQDRSVRVGEMVVINGYQVNHTTLKQRFAEGGYEVQETPHFLFFTRKAAPSTLLVHWFAPDTTPSVIQHTMREELAPLELLQQSGEQRALLDGMLASLNTQGIRLYDRSLDIAEMTVMSGFDLDRGTIKKRFIHNGYEVQETPHFLLCTHQDPPSTTLIHWFAPEDSLPSYCRRTRTVGMCSSQPAAR